jgi:hypothetical protein
MRHLADAIEFSAMTRGKFSMSIMGFTPILEFVYCRAIIAARDGSEAIDGAADRGARPYS